MKEDEDEAEEGCLKESVEEWRKEVGSGGGFAF